MSGKRSIVVSPRMRRRSLAVEINRSLKKEETPKGGSTLFFEALEPRILLSADGILPMPLDIGLLDTVSEIDPADADIGKLPEELKSATPEPETGHVNPDANQPEDVLEESEAGEANKLTTDSLVSSSLDTDIQDSSADVQQLEGAEVIVNADSEESNAAQELQQETVSADDVLQSEDSDADILNDLDQSEEQLSTLVDEVESEETSSEPLVEENTSTEHSADVPLQETSTASSESVSEQPALQIVFIDKSIDDYSSLINNIAGDGVELVFGDQEGSNSEQDNTLSVNADTIVTPSMSSSDGLVSEDQNGSTQFTSADSMSTLTETVGSAEAETPTNRVVVYFIESGENGVELIADRLSEYQDVDAVHVLSHGAAGMINLGNARLHSDSIDRYGDALSRWGAAMAVEGDVFLYGCDVAGSEEGVQFVEDVAQHIGANIAASNDATGNVINGGDFDFEVIIGEIDTQSLFSSGEPLGFSGLLPAEQLVFVMASGENAVSISADATSITISDGTTETTTLIADITDILITGVDNEDDTLTVDFDTSFLIDIQFDGGAGGNDTLIFDNGMFDTVTYTATAFDSGDIVFNAGGESATVSYTGLEPVTDNSVAADRVFIGTADVNNIQLTNATDAGQSIIQDVVGGTFESITFNNPTNSLVIDGGDGADIIDIDVAQDAGFAPAAGIEIRGGGGSDTLRLDASGALPSGITFDGQGDDDRIEIRNGNLASAAYTSTGAGAGDIELVETGVGGATSSLSFSGIEEIDDSSTTADLTITAGSGIDNILLDDGAVAGQSIVTGDIAITFDNPTDSLVIAGGDGDDVITIDATLDAGLAPSAGITVDGGANNDTFIVDATAFPEDLVIDGGTGTADALELNGGMFSAVSYTGTGVGAGDIALEDAAATVTTLSYDGLETITDTSATDALTIIGGPGNEQIDLVDADAAGTGRSAVNADVDISFNNPLDSLVIGGGAGNDDITIAADLDAGLAPTSGIVIQGGEGDDSLTLDLSSPIPANLSFDGGAGDTDTLILNNGTFESVSYNLDAAGAGDIALDTGTAATSSQISYSELEAVDDQSTAATRTVTGSSLDDNITLSDADGATTGQSQIDSDIAIRFNNPTDRLVLQGGGGADTIVATGVQDPDLILADGLLIDGGAGDDEVQIDGNENYIATLLNNETIIVNGEDESNLDIAEVDQGLQAFSTFLARLQEFGQFDAQLPLTDDVTIGDLSGLSDTIARLRADLLANPDFDGMGAGDPSLANFEDFLEAWAPTFAGSGGFGDITVSTSGVTPTVVEVQNGNTLISRSISIAATRQASLDIQNTDELAEANLQLETGSSSYDVGIDTDLTFTIGSNVTAGGFVTQIGELAVEASGNTIDLEGDVAVGVLGGSIDTGSASYDLLANIDVTFDDPQSDGVSVSLAELNAANTSSTAADALADINGSGVFDVSFGFTPDGGFAPTLASTIDVGGITYDLFDDYQFGAPINLNSDDLYGISLLNARDLLEPLTDFAIWLDQLTASDLYDGNVQLVDGQRVGDLLDFAQLLRDQIISEITTAATVDTGNGSTIAVAVPDFVTVQDLSALMDAVDPTRLAIDYDQTSGSLGFSVSLDQSSVQLQDFDYNLMLESLNTLNSDVQVSINTELGLDFEFRFDLAIVDQPVLVPGHADATFQTGVLDNDAQFEITVGSNTQVVTIAADDTSFNTSIADLILDINDALLDAFGAGVVTASLDTALGEDNPRLALTAADPITINSIDPIDGGVLEQAAEFNLQIQNLAVYPEVIASASRVVTVDIDTTNDSEADIVDKVNDALDLQFGNDQILATLDTSGATSRILLSLDRVDATAILSLDNVDFLLTAADGETSFELDLTTFSSTPEAVVSREVTLIIDALSDSEADIVDKLNDALDLQFGVNQITATLDNSGATSSILLSLDRPDAFETLRLNNLDDVDFLLTEPTGEVTFVLDLITVASANITLNPDSSNTNLMDLVDDINDALDIEFGANQITAILDESGETPQILLSTDSANPDIVVSLSDLNFLITAQKAENPATSSLGLVPNETGSSTVFDVNRNGFINTRPDFDISSSPEDFVFDLEVDGARTTGLTVTAADVAALAATVPGPLQASDLVDLFNDEFTANGLVVEAKVDAGRLVFSMADSASATSLRILAEEGNPVVSVLGFVNAQFAVADEQAPAYFDTNATSIDGTIRTSWQDPNATGQYGFVEIEFDNAAAQSTLTLHAELQDDDNQIDLIELNGDLGEIVNGPVSSGSLSDTLGDADYVANDALRALVTSAGDVQFAISLDGHVLGETNTAEHQISIESTQASIFGDATAGFSDTIQILVSGELAAETLRTGELSGTASFDLSINGGQTLALSVNTVGNVSSIDLVDDINGAISAAVGEFNTANASDFAFAITAELLNDVLVFRVDNNGLLAISNTNLIAQTELQLLDGDAADRVVLSDLERNSLISYEGRPGTDISFEVQIDGGTPVTISVSQDITADNFIANDPNNVFDNGLEDLANDINVALVAAGITASQVEARVVASRIALVNTGAADTQLRVSASRMDTQVSGASVQIIESVDASAISNALIEFAEVLSLTDFQDTDSGPVSYLNSILPIINQSALEMNDYISAFENLTNEIAGIDAGSIQQFEKAVNELLGLDHEIVVGVDETGFTEAGIAFTYNAGNVLGVDLVFEKEEETEFNFFVDAYELGGLVADGPDLGGDPDRPLQINSDKVLIRDPLNAVELVAESFATVDLSLAIDFTGDTVASVLADTNVDLDIRVDESDINFQAKVGPASLFVQGGSVIIDADGDASTPDFLSITTEFQEFVLDGSGAVIGEVGQGEDIEIDLNGAATVVVPLFSNASVTSALPSAADPDSPGSPLTFNLVDIAAVIAETEGSVVMPDSADLPNLADLVDSGLLNLLADPSLIIDGIDNLLSAIQTAIEVPSSQLTQLPLIGDQIDDALQPFLDQINQARIDLKDFLLDAYAENIAAPADPMNPGVRYDGDLMLILQETLYDVFAGSSDLLTQTGDADVNRDGDGPRLGLLQDLATDGNPNVGFEDIVRTTAVTDDDEYVQYDFHLGQSYSISVPFELGLGTSTLSLDSFLPGMDFSIGSDEGITLDIAWDLRIGFGLSLADGFYINTVHTENIADASSDYVEELVLALDVTIPGLEAEVGIGLVAAEITDGVDGPTTITSLQKVSVANTGISPGSIDINELSLGVEGGSFQLHLYKDTFDANGNLTGVEEVLASGGNGFIYNVDGVELTGATPADIAANFALATADLFFDLTRIDYLTDILFTPELSNINPLNPGFGLTFTALDPDVTRIEFEHISGNNFGFGEVLKDTLGNVTEVLDQFEDGRAIGLGFADGQQAVNGELMALFETPVGGAIAEDILFALVVRDNAGTNNDIEVMLRASGIKGEVEDSSGNMVEGTAALAVQVQEALDLALGEAGLTAGSIIVNLIEDDQAPGQFFFQLVNDNSYNVGRGIQSIEYNTQETSGLSLKVAVDLFGDVNESDVDPVMSDSQTADGEDPPNLDRPRLTLSELVSSPKTSIFVTADADAKIRLHVETVSPDFITGSFFEFLALPTIEFDFKAGLNGSVVLFGQVDPDMPADQAFEFGYDDIDFDNIQVDLGELLGSFIQPILGSIDTVLGPIFDIIGDGVDSSVGFLNAPIPLLSDIAPLIGQPSDLSWLDLTGNKDSFNQFFGVVQQLATLGSAISSYVGNAANDGKVNLGGWRIVLDDESPFYFPNTKLPVPIAVANAYDGLSSEEVSLLQILGVSQSGSTIPEPGGFQLDLLDPGNIFKLITGDTFDIFSFNLPKLEFELGIDFGFDFRVLDFDIDGSIGVTVELGIGYDSTGLDRIRDARNAGVPIDPEDLLDGFFIDTIAGGGPELQLDANFAGRGGVDIHTPSFCVDLGFLGSVCFPRFDIFVVEANIAAQFGLALDIIDPNEDGKLRFDEISELTSGFSNPQNIIFLFDVTGSASGSFDISGVIAEISLSTSDLGLGALAFDLDFSAQDFFSSAFGIPNPFNPIVAEYITANGAPTGVIRVNAGEFAYARIFGDTNDFTGSNVTITSIGNLIRFTDNTTGASTVLSASGVNSIIFRGVEARDVINASGLTQDISLDIRGAGGNDLLIGGAGADVILGQTGNDNIQGRNGNDTLFGERGADTILGEAGFDILSGGQDNDSLLGGNDGDRYVYLTTADERGGFDKDTIVETEVETGFTQGRVIAISAILEEEGTNRILVTAENHGLADNDSINITGVVGVSTANGNVTVDYIDENTFAIDNRRYVGNFNSNNGAGYIIDRNIANLDGGRSPTFNFLTDTIDLSAATTSQSLSFKMNTAGTSVSFVDEEVAVNTITHTGMNIETLLGGDGNDFYDISANGNGTANHFTNLDGGEGSDQYVVRVGNLNGDVNIQDLGVANATDTLFVFGRDDDLITDNVGLTNAAILFDIGLSSANQISYSPVGADGEPVESGLEVIQIDLLRGDDNIGVESTPTESTVTVNGGLGSDTFNVGVDALTGVATNLNDIDGTEDNGPLRLFGNAEDPNLLDNDDDIDRVRIFDTTDTNDNNVVNGDAGTLSHNADTGISSLTGLGITIGVEYGGVETAEITLGEGDDEFLMLGTIDGNRIDDPLTGTGITTLNGGPGNDILDLSLAGGGLIKVNGNDDNDIITLNRSASADLILSGNDGDDEINLLELSALATVSVSGGMNNDTINLGSTRSSSDAALGDVNSLDGMITLTGNDGIDTLIVDDSLDTAGNNTANGDAGVLNASTLTGLGMTNGIGEYVEFEQVYIHTGSGADQFYVQSTDVDAITLVDTNAGDDAIIVSSAAPDTAGHLDGVEGDLVLHGGDGTNALLISDIGTATADDNVVMDEGDFDPLRTFIRAGSIVASAGLQNHHSITGLAGQSRIGAPFTTGTIYYSSEFNGATGDFHGQDAVVGGITIRAGNLGNSFQINSVYSDDLTTLYTGSGNDTVVTGDLSSVVSGANPTADGNLLVFGQQGEDSVDASLSTITVTLDGGEDDDVLFGGSAADLIVGGRDGDYLDGGDGDDLIYGDSTVTLDLDAQTTSRTTIDSDGKDFLVGAGGADTLQGELGNDVLFGDNATAIRNGAGVITSIVSSDPMGTEQTLTSSGGAGAVDQLFGETGNDILVGGVADDILQGNEGEDILYGDNARILFEDMAGMSNPLRVESTDTDTGGNDTIFGDTEGSTDGENDIVFGGIGDDTIQGQGGNDILFGDNGDVVLNDGSAEANDLLSTAGDDFGADTISGGAGDDIIIGDHANVVRDDTNTVENITSTFMTGADDVLTGDSENDTIVGGLGADQIMGNDGNDIILGDQGIVDVTNGQTSTSDPALGGDDVIDGGEGNNQILAGNGMDTITTGSGNDIIVGDNGTTDGQTTTSTDFGLGADDVINAGQGNNQVIAGAGNDQVTTGGGQDIIVGDSGTTDGTTTTSLATAIGGNDTIVSGAGGDEVIGGAGNDNINSGSGNDAVLGDSGTTNGVTSTSIDAGIGGNDVIVSGTGNDEVIGGAGSDNINSGSGNDAVLGDSGTTNGVTSTSTDTGIGGNDVIVSGTGNDEVIGGAGSDNINSGSGNDAVLGDSGTTNGVTSTSIDPGVGGNDVIVSGTGDDEVIGGAGMDNINSGDGNDAVLGDSGTTNGATSSSLAPTIGGDDIIVTGLGDDQVIGGVGADMIMTGLGNDSILGDNGITTGDTTTSTDPSVGGDDIIDAGEGMNQVVAGQGNDMITTGDGDDAILGDNGTTNGDRSESTEPNIGGQDVIDAGGGRNQIIGGDDRDEITSQNGNDVVLGDSGITTNSVATSFAAGSGGDDTIETGGGNDLIIGGAGNDDITSGSGNDAVIGDSGTTNGSTTTSSAPGIGGNDMIDTGAGNDQVIGGVGSDNINSGSGDDAVLGDNGTTNGSTTTSSDAGIGGNDTIVSGDGSDQVIGGAGSDNIDVGSGNDSVIGDNGTTNGSSSESNAPATGGNDTIRASGGNNQIIGGAGGDNITSGNGNDVILGDNGRVTRSTATSASPTIGGNDNIQSGGGLDLVIGGAGSDIINGGGGNDSILGDNGVLTLSSVQTTDPSVGGNDRLEGGAGDDAILGGAGSDDISGGAGNDRILGDNGFWIGGRLETTDLSIGGNDSISGGADNDWILGGFGNDNIRGDGGFDVLLGDNGYITPLGNNIFKAATTGLRIGGDDVIDGGAGNDILIGGFGKDTLIGNLGEDILIGDNGVVIFSGDGTILQIDAFGTDPLDRSASFNLYGRDLDIDYSNEEAVAGQSEGPALTRPYQLADFQMGNDHRFQHHHVPIEAVVEDNESEQPVDETNPDEAQPAAIETDTALNVLPVIEANAIQANATATPQQNASVVDLPADTAAYVGAASLALHGWHRRSKKAGRKTAATNNTVKADTRVFSGFRRAG